MYEFFVSRPQYVRERGHQRGHHYDDAVPFVTDRVYGHISLCCSVIKSSDGATQGSLHLYQTTMPDQGGHEREKESRA